MINIEGRVDSIQATEGFKNASVRLTGPSMSLVLVIEMDSAPRLGKSYKITLEEIVDSDIFLPIEVSVPDGIEIN